MIPTTPIVLRAAAVLSAAAWILPPPPLPTDLQAFCERLSDRAATQKTLTVFESADSRVTVLDSAGQVLRTFGRHGEGPAEFRLSPMIFGSRQRFRSAPDGRVLSGRGRVVPTVPV